MRFTTGILIAAATAVAAGCAGAPARQGELLTVAQLRERQASAQRPDTLAIPSLGRSAVRPAGAADSVPQPVAERPRATTVAARDATIAPGAAGARRPERAVSRASAQRRQFPRPRWIQVEGEQPVIPLILYDEPLTDVVSGLAEEVGINIVPANDTTVRDMRLTAEVRDLPWPLALEAVLEAHGLRPVQLPSGVIKIVSENTAREDQDADEVRLRFLTGSDVQKALEGILRSGPDSASARVDYIGDPATTRRLVVYGSTEKISAVRSLIARLDRRPPTISVETQILNVDRAQMRKVGVSYAFGRVREDSTGQIVPIMDVRPTTTPQGGITSANGPALEVVRRLGGFGKINLNVFVDAVLGTGYAETQTTPFLTTTSEMPAQVRIGDAIVLPNQQPLFGGLPQPYQQPGYGPDGGQQQGGAVGPGGYGDGRGGLQPAGSSQQGGGAAGIYPGYGASAGGFTRFETGTTLRVTPYALGDNLIRVKIDLERDGGTLSPDGRSITGGNQTAYTDVIVRDGSPIVIAGLTINARSRGQSGVPVLGDLPLVGQLFRTNESAESYRDLIIILTPRIETDELVTSY